MYVYFFIYKSCVCPRAMTSCGGAVALTSSSTAASKADMWVHLWRRGWAWPTAASVTNMHFLQEQLLVLNCMGQTCRYSVTCQARLYNVSEGCSMGWRRPHVPVHPLAGNGMEESFLPADRLAKLGLACAARWRMSVGVPFLTSRLQWDWHSSIMEKKCRFHTTIR